VNDTGRWKRLSRIAGRLADATRASLRPELAGAPFPPDSRSPLDPALHALFRQALQSLVADSQGCGRGAASAIQPSGRIRAVRIAGRRCGSEPQLLAAVPGAAGPEGRGEARVDCPGEEVLVTFRGVEGRAHMENLSALGMMLKARFVPELGEPLTVRRPGGTGLRYFVRWVRDGQIGLGCREDDVIADPGRNGRRAGRGERLGVGLARAAHLFVGSASPAAVLPPSGT
jgi:hypothetical protein